MPDPENFDIDSLKKTWQDQVILDDYNQDEIESILNKKSRNYVKYILWISMTEFLIFGLINFISIFTTNGHHDFIGILEKLHIKNQNEIEIFLDRIYSCMKIFSLIIAGIFVLIFFRNYKKIKVESNIKKHIIQIIMFKKTVNLFILCNILLLVVFVLSFMGIIAFTVKQQNIIIEKTTFCGLVIGIVLSFSICITLIFAYYKLAYGILLNRLSSNLKQLKKLDEENF